MMHFQVVCIY